MSLAIFWSTSRWRKFLFIGPSENFLLLINKLRFYCFSPWNYTIFYDYCYKSHRNLSKWGWVEGKKWTETWARRRLKRNWDKFEAGFSCFLIIFLLPFFYFFWLSESTGEEEGMNYGNFNMNNFPSPWNLMTFIYLFHIKVSIVRWKQVNLHHEKFPRMGKYFDYFTNNSN